MWCNALEHDVKSRGHFFATVNYIHHNPVKHGYVKLWQEWAYSSAEEYLAQYGRKRALANWKAYDISKMGIDWDID